MLRKMTAPAEMIDRRFWLDFAGIYTLKITKFLAQKYLPQELNLTPESTPTILNLGSGGKEISAGFARYLPQAEIIDLDYAAFSKNNAYRNFIQGDIQRLPFKNTFADLVFCFFVFFYLENKYQAAIEISRVLRPGGKALFLFHTPYSVITQNLLEMQPLKLKPNDPPALQRAAGFQRYCRENYRDKMFESASQIHRFAGHIGLEILDLRLLRKNLFSTKLFDRDPRDTTHDCWLVLVKKPG